MNLYLSPTTVWIELLESLALPVYKNHEGVKTS